MKIVEMKPQIKMIARNLGVFVFVSMIAFLSVTAIVRANAADEIQEIQEKIDKIESLNEKKEKTQGVLSVQASSLSDAINKLQERINASQARINSLQEQIKKLEKQINETEIELENQKDLLGQSIKSMYVSGEISTIEMLASSKDLSDFFDKQQYQESVRQKIKNTLDKITELKLELNAKKEQVASNLSEQKSVKAQIESQQDEKNRILALNQQQQNELENQIKKNNTKLAELREQQAAAEAALAASLSSGNYKVAKVGPVSAGSVVGSIGNTGFSDGAHLHLEVRTNSGQIINPGPYIRRSPVDIPPAVVTQGFGVSNPIYYSGFHPGIDYATGGSGPIYAIDSGMMYRGCSDQMLGTSGNPYGYIAIVEHANGKKSIYAHMSGGPSACDYNTYPY